jgi:hypothetical protein
MEGSRGAAGPLLHLAGATHLHLDAAHGGAAGGDVEENNCGRVVAGGSGRGGAGRGDVAPQDRPGGGLTGVAHGACGWWGWRVGGWADEHTVKEGGRRRGGRSRQKRAFGPGPENSVGVFVELLIGFRRILCWWKRRGARSPCQASPHDPPLAAMSGEAEPAAAAPSTSTDRWGLMFAPETMCARLAPVHAAPLPALHRASRDLHHCAAAGWSGSTWCTRPRRTGGSPCACTSC